MSSMWEEEDDQMKGIEGYFLLLLLRPQVVLDGIGNGFRGAT